jgi:cytochrome c oxidase subunit IV
MSGAHESEHDINESVRKYLYVFYALLFGTAITVAASYIQFGSHEINIAVALAIASGKAFLVIAYFMHLISEKKMIYGILVFTVLFVIGLMYLTLASTHSANLIHLSHVS